MMMSEVSDNPLPRSETSDHYRAPCRENLSLSYGSTGKNVRGASSVTGENKIGNTVACWWCGLYAESLTFVV
jgi:hypothetical protein